MFDSRAVANYFLSKAMLECMALSFRKLQQLVFFAHGWHLALTDTPLIRDAIKRGEYGPQCDVMQHETMYYNNYEEMNHFTWYDSWGVSHSYRTWWKSDDTAKAIVDKVWEVYKNSMDAELLGMHWHLWETNKLDNESIKKEFQEQARKNKDVQ